MLTVEQLITNSFSLLSYIIRDEGRTECLIIDPPRDIASRIDLDTLKIKAVVNTHIHPDHTLGNRSLAGMAPILAHPRENTLPLRCYNAVFTFLLSGRIQPRISFILSEETKVVLGNTSIEVLHTPGHSPGSICLYWDGNLIAGDTVFVEGIGRTDIPGGSMVHLKKSISKIMDLPGDTVIWPGHSYGGAYRTTISEATPFLKWIVNTL
jgi:hydroxyacylglutathione hydrolase